MGDFWGKTPRTDLVITTFDLEENRTKFIKTWWDWIGRVFDVYMQSAYDQQVHLVEIYFKHLDFRHFQINLRDPIGMDVIHQIEHLVAYGARLSQMILNDKMDSSQGIIIKHPGYF